MSEIHSLSTRQGEMHPWVDRRSLIFDRGPCTLCGAGWAVGRVFPSRGAAHAWLLFQGGTKPLR